MPVKPNGALCAIKVIAGRALPFGDREIIFDDDLREAAAGTLLGEFRRPSWLKEVPWAARF